MDSEVDYILIPQFETNLLRVFSKKNQKYGDLYQIKCYRDFRQIVS